MKILKIFNSDILVRELFVKLTTTNGLYNPNADKQYPFRVGVVVKSDSNKFHIGDAVGFDMYAGTTMMHDNKEHLILNENNIFATIGLDGEFVEKEER